MKLKKFTLLLVYLNIISAYAADGIQIVKKAKEYFIEISDKPHTAYFIEESNDLIHWNKISDRAKGKSSIKIESYDLYDKSFYRLNTWNIEDEEIYIAIIGDSTAASEEINSFKFCGWGEAFPDFFESRATVLNFAVPGHSTKWYLGGVNGQSEKSYHFKRLKLIKPQFVLMQFGIIDETSGVPEKITTIDEYKINYKVLIEGIRNFGGTPIILSPVNRAVFDENQNHYPWLSERSAAAKEIADALNVHFIDMNTITGNYYKTLGPDGLSDIIAEGDEVHYSPEGAVKICELIIDELPNYLKYFLIKD